MANLGSSNEADRAITRAAIALLENQLAAHESVYGKWDGIRSDRWSVLTSGELDGIEDQLRQRMRLLLSETVSLPTVAGSPDVLALNEELRAQIAMLEIERARRGASKTQLMNISETATAASDGAAFQQLDKVTGQQLEFEAEKLLAFEIEKASAWDPGNHAIESIDVEIKKGPHRAEIVRLVRESIWKGGWPPGRGPPPGWKPPPGWDPPPEPEPPSGASSGPSPDDPPGPSGGAAAVADVRDGVAAEIRALSQGDLRTAADGAARWNTATAWLNRQVGHPETGFGGAVLSLSDVQLKDTLTAFESLKAVLVQKNALSPSSGRSLLELRDINSRIETIRSEIRIRGPPAAGADIGPRGDLAMARAADFASTAGNGGEYGAYAAQTLEEQRLFELESKAIWASGAQGVFIQEAIGTQKARVRQIRVEMVKRAQAIEARAYVYGRGLSGVLATDNANVLRNQVAAAGTTRSVSEAIATGGNVVFNHTPQLGQQFALGTKAVSSSEAPDLLQFDKSFPRDGPNSIAAFRSAPRLAPGGVIVDLTLPDAITSRLVGINYDPISQHFGLNIQAEGWKELSPAIRPETARAAMGFVMDGRVAAIDIGTFRDLNAIRWLEHKGVLPTRRTKSEDESLVRGMTILSVVRYNPAIAHTVIASDLVLADELIFRVTSLDLRQKASDSVFRGLDVREPHLLMEADRQELGTGVGAKSVLSIDGLELTNRDQNIHAEPRFVYTIYLGEARATRVSDWLTSHHPSLVSRSPELQRLVEFSVAVAVLRSAKAKSLLNDVSILRFVIDPGDPSPSLICRSDVPRECGASFFQNLTAVPETLLER